MIDEKLCEYIKSIEKNKSFSKAADELYIAQPSLSRFVKSLEERLGVELFDRSSVPLETTKAGLVLLEFISKFEKLQKEMDDEFLKLSSQNGNRLTIGTLPYLGAYILPQMVSSFKKIYPEVDLNIVEYNNRTIANALINEDIDLYITNLPPKSDPIDYKIIKPDPLFLVGIKTPQLEERYDLSNNSLDNPRLIDIFDFENETFILLHPWQNMRVMVDKVFKHFNFKVKNFVETSSVANSLNLVNCGKGLAFICESALQLTNIEVPLVYFSLSEMRDVASIIISYKKENKNPLVEEFCQNAYNTFSF